MSSGRGTGGRFYLGLLNMDAKERVIRRMVPILRSGLATSDYPGVTMILVSDRLVRELVQQAADAIGGGTGPVDVTPPVRIKGGG